MGQQPRKARWARWSSVGDYTTAMMMLRVRRRGTPHSTNCLDHCRHVEQAAAGVESRQGEFGCRRNALGRVNHLPCCVFAEEGGAGA
jgi:hypothetical protein